MGDKNTKLIVIAIAVVLVGGIFLFANIEINPPAPGETNAPAGGLPTAPSGGNPQVPSVISPPAPRPQPSAPASGPISVTSPASGAEWILNKNNVIAWSKEAGRSGSIYLSKAAGGEIVGWILPNTNSHQTSYTWDTRDLFLSRTSAQKKNIEPGSYRVLVQFDGGGQTLVSSPVFSIINPSQVKIEQQNVNIQGIAFTPADITAKRGSKVVVTNGDSVTYRIILSGVLTYTVQPGESFAVDTLSLTAGSYTFYSEEYTGLRATLNVVP